MAAGLCPDPRGSLSAPSNTLAAIEGVLLLRGEKEGKRRGGEAGKRKDGKGRVGPGRRRGGKGREEGRDVFLTLSPRSASDSHRLQHSTKQTIQFI